MFGGRFLGRETTSTTGKNNFYGGQHASRIVRAARLRGEKEEVVFTRCYCCFQSNMQAKPAHFIAEAKARIVPKTFEDSGGNVRYKEDPGVDHNCWTPTCADKDALKWFFAQRKS